jgi:hypothetical protein
MLTQAQAVSTLRSPRSIQPTQACELASHLHQPLLTVDCILLCMILPTRASSQQQTSNVGCLMTATVAVASRCRLQPRQPTQLLHISSLPLLATCARHPHWIRVLPIHRCLHHLIPPPRTCIRKTPPFMTTSPGAWCPLLSLHLQTTQANRCVRSCRSRPSPRAARRRIIPNPALRGSHRPRILRTPHDEFATRAPLYPHIKSGDDDLKLPPLHRHYPSLSPPSSPAREHAGPVLPSLREVTASAGTTTAASGVEERLSRRLDGLKLSGRSNDDRARACGSDP